MTIVKFSRDEQAVATLRLLSVDMIAKAKSGHPGAPLGMAPTAHVLFTRHLVADARDPKWAGRDRVVLSNGHASSILYALLHVSGYKLNISDLQQFRSVGSKTPGHPEARKTDGVEVTTGPLGQGLAQAVGLAIAQANMGATFGHRLFNNRTWVFCGDGCLQEGVAYEAISLAGHLRLKNLVVLYDDNHITIDGGIDNSFTEDVGARFEAMGWDVIAVEDANSDLEVIDAAITKAKSNDRPTLVKLRTIIGYGASAQGTAGVHGSPLPVADVQSLKAQWGFNPDETFAVPEGVYQQYSSTLGSRGAAARSEWDAAFEDLPSDRKQELSRRLRGDLPEGWEACLPVYPDEHTEELSTRKHSERVLNALAPLFPEFIGGSADLTSCVFTQTNGAVDFQAPETGLGSYEGRYLRYGVREHGMGAIMNGLAAYGGYIPFGGTFLNFVFYAAPALRLSALSEHRVLWVATHDSIGVGEDGPTHQPIEAGPWLRASPNVNFWRPAEGNETSAAYASALTSLHTPTVIGLTRQNVPAMRGTSLSGARRGGYVLRDVPHPAVTLVATGSEVAVALSAATNNLAAQGFQARVVSLPCWDVFAAQTEEYRRDTFGSAPVLSVEAYSSFGWGKYSHAHVGLDGFGDSAAPAVLFKHFGITSENVATNAIALVQKYKGAAVPVLAGLE